jgi:hypothetical protein
MILSEQLPPTWSEDARGTATFRLNHYAKTLEYADNFRWARCSVPAELAEYHRLRQNGCCGFQDDVFFCCDTGEPYLVGCNYGH